MSKIGTITIKIPFGDSRREAIAALAATMRPFGSLPPRAAVIETWPDDVRALGSAEDLAARMLDWIDGGPSWSRAPSIHQKSEAACAVLRTLQGQQCDDLCAVEFGGAYIQLRTPTSGTTIRLSRQSWCHAIGVVFGAGGSTDRYRQISEALAAAGIGRHVNVVPHEPPDDGDAEHELAH